MLSQVGFLPSLAKQEATDRALWKWGNKVLRGSYTPESVCPSSVLIGGHLPSPGENNTDHSRLKLYSFKSTIKPFCNVEIS